MKSIREKKKSMREEEFPNLMAYTTSKMEILERIEELEDEVFKDNSHKASSKQRILLLKHSGILAHIDILFENLDLKDKGSFLSILFGLSDINIIKSLRDINQKESDLETSRNYKKLVEIFKEVGLKEQESFCDQRLDNLLKFEESKRKR